MNESDFRDECVKRQSPPSNIQLGDVLPDGCFLRNLKKEHAKLRFQNDDPENPQYGRKLHPSFWRDATKQPGGLSVNDAKCTGSASCSIATQVDAHRYFHVASLDLGALNSLPELTTRIVAVYDPIDDDVEKPNLCHFEILPEDGTVSKLQELMVALDNPFPDCLKLPSDEVIEQKAENAWQRYQEILDIQPWVRNRSTQELSD